MKLFLLTNIFAIVIITISCEKKESSVDEKENKVTQLPPIEGYWEGDNIFFYVSDSGLKITGTNSPLEGERSVIMLIPVNQNSAGVSAVNAFIYTDIIINDDNTFKYEDENLSLEGKFTSTDSTIGINKAEGSVTYSGRSYDETNSVPIEGSFSWEAEPSIMISALTLSSGSLVPDFSTNIYEYSVNVGYDISNITITPKASNSNIIFLVDSVPCSSGNPSQPISLDVGENEITVEVDAHNGSKKQYTVNVTREEASANLSSLEISSGTLTPLFSENITDYNTTVNNGVESITITPTAEDEEATIEVNTVLCSSGNPSQSISLDEGDNTITIKVTSQEGLIKNYIIDVTRAPVSASDKLCSISVTDGGADSWHVQFSQNVTGLEIGVVYTITFDAYASRYVSIMCDINQGGGSYQQVLYEGGQSPVFNISTTKTTFTRTVVSTIEDEGDGISALQFNLGNQGAYDIYIDNVSVTADGVEQLINGDFLSPITTGWNDIYLYGTGEAAVSIIEP